ncbi:hypothetical protein LEP1GSC019_3980 [Leptospira interrogans serovar Pyrogenes str. 2006006960]|nr:hypothetical protein LEP1GSC019_3980 [Leptospira interrogans serovar Pyrogenes str. 2006006960]
MEIQQKPSGVPTKIQKILESLQNVSSPQYKITLKNLLI